MQYSQEVIQEILSENPRVSDITFKQGGKIIVSGSTVAKDGENVPYIIRNLKTLESVYNFLSKIHDKEDNNSVQKEITQEAIEEIREDKGGFANMNVE